MADEPELEVEEHVSIDMADRLADTLPIEEVELEASPYPPRPPSVDGRAVTTDVNQRGRRRA